MRRLLPLVSAIVLVDTMLYATLVPLLPHYASRLHLTKAGAGGLVAAYAAGLLVSGLPSGLLASRVGPQRAVRVGLGLTSAAGFGFAFAGDAVALWIARFLQGAGSAASWSGGLAWLLAVTPRERRGAALGTAMGAAVFGAMLGPAVGAVASVAGIRPTLAAVAAVGLALAAYAARAEPAPADPQPLAAIGGALRDERFRAGLWLLLLPAILSGILVVLVPLRLARHGFGAAAIGGVFLAAAAGEVVLNPLLGRLLDRRGRLGPVRAVLTLSALLAAALALASAAAPVAVLAVAAAVAFGGLYAPGLALIADGAERVGLSQALGMGLMNGAWALGNVFGPSAGGALADALGDSVPYAGAAALCAATLAATAAAPRLARAAAP